MRLPAKLLRAGKGNGPKVTVRMSLFRARPSGSVAEKELAGLAVDLAREWNEDGRITA
jgi:hypothetical protein